MSQLWVIYGLVFFAAILAVESLYWLAYELRGAKKTINRRLALSEKSRPRARFSTFCAASEVSPTSTVPP